LQESVKASRDGVKVAVVNYQQGRINFVVVSTLQESLLQQENLLAQAQGDLAIALINVYRALGGGWQIRLADNGYGAACDVWAVPPVRVPAAPAGRPEPLPAPMPAPVVPQPNP
jgi:hypothetical protein